jgi:hypothetical protein
MGTKVLEFSPWEESIAPHIYKDAEITRADWVAPVDPEYVGKFDAVVANGILQRFGYMAAPSAINAWVSCLNETGELHIVVPSLEWIAREILAESPSPVVMVALYGGQGGDGSVHTSGYTMRLLRSHLVRCNLYCTKARTQSTSIEVNGLVYQFDQHYVCGSKVLKEPSME